MKPSMFKIRRFNANNTESKEGPHSLTPKEREESELYQATQACQENMGKLMTMFQSFMKQSAGGSSTKPATRYQGQTFNRGQLQYEARDRHIIFQIPEFEGQQVTQKALELWTTEICNAAFSSAFNFYVNEQMTFEQAKVFCAETIFENILRLSERYKLEDKHLQMIDIHLSGNILPYLQKKYPLTTTFDVNKALEKQLEQTNNMDLLENDFLVSHEIMFKYRSNGNYNDMIMKVLNKAMQICDQTAPFSVVNNSISNYQDFQIYMSDLFEKVYNEEWVLGIHASKNKEKDNNNHALKLRQEEQRQKYKQKVKEYTNYAINRKISENTPQFTDQQIRGQNLTIHNPAILRILTKWCEQLWNKFTNEFYFTERAEQVMLQDPAYINPFFKWMKTSIDKKMQLQRTKIEEFKKNLDEHCHYQQSVTLLKYLQEDDVNFIPKYEKAYGKFSTHMVKNLHSYIIMYLNRIIHGLLTVSKDFFDKQVDKSWDDWPAPPNLITFKIGDLIRCKCSSKQKEIVALYKNILHISNNNPEKIKITRIKNRLKEGTNDILINVKFNQKIISQIQLQVINKSKTKFIQCSNKFCHFIYELQRSIFGPVSQMCNIWNNFEPRSKIFQTIQKTKSIQYDMTKAIQGLICSHEGEHQFENYVLPFQCSKCCKNYFHNNYIFPNKKCKNCLTYVCVKCQIKDWNSDELMLKLFKGSKIVELMGCCQKLIGQKIPENGVCVKIESRQIKPEIFKYKKVESKYWLFGLRQDQQLYQIEKIKNSKEISAFLNDYCIFSLSGDQKKLSISDNQALKFTVREYLRDSYKQNREALVLTQIRFTKKEMEELISSDGARDIDRKRIKKIEYASNYIDSIAYFSVFENLTSINIDYNHIESFKEVTQWKHLQKIQFRENKKIMEITEDIKELQKLESLVMRSCNLNFIHENIGILRGLHTLMLAQNKLVSLPSVISNLINLKQLDVSSNLLTALPNMEGLVNLKKLQMSKNRLTAIPDELTTLTNLSFVSFHSNKIQNFPANLKNLQKLQKIDVHSNKIKEISSDSFQIQSLKFISLSQNTLTDFNINLSFCKNLQHLAVNANKISALPESLQNCANLIHLTFQDNQIEKFPDCISKLKKMKILQFQNNKINQVPKSILEMTWVTKLNFSGNLLEDIPQGLNRLQMLTHLNFNNNKFKKVPQSIKSMPKLIQTIEFKDNEIQQIPQFIAQLQFVKKSPKVISVMFEKNKIKNVNPTIIDLMGPNLTLAINQLEIFPIINISNKEAIKFIDFNNNHIKQIPRMIKQFTALEKLHVSNNKIQIIPLELAQCKSMRLGELKIAGNPIHTIECMPFVLKHVDFYSKSIVDSVQQKQKGLPEEKVQN